MMRGPFGPGTIVLGGGAILLFVVLGIGLLLPTDWEASATGTLDAAPSDVLAFLDSPEGWRAWTPWPDAGLVRSGPDRGPGAGISWDDQELGSGTFTIDATQGDTSVSYSVRVAGAGGAVMRTNGSVTMSPADDGGVSVLWREEGDLGRNPLMGYWALSMERAQSAEMAKGLDQLAEVVREALSRNP